LLQRGGRGRTVDSLPRLLREHNNVVPGSLLWVKQASNVTKLLDCLLDAILVFPQYSLVRGTEQKVGSFSSSKTDLKPKHESLFTPIY